MDLYGFVLIYIDLYGFVLFFIGFVLIYIDLYRFILILNDLCRFRTMYVYLYPFGTCIYIYYICLDILNLSCSSF